jgi:hypothetical protein
MKGIVHVNNVKFYYTKVSKLTINTEVTKITPEEMKEYLWIFGDDLEGAKVEIGELDSYGYVKTIIIE